MILAKQVLVRWVVSDKVLNRRNVKDMIRKGWGDLENLTIINMGANVFLFNFDDDELPNKILQDAPWNVLGCVLTFQRWIPEIALHEVNFSFFPFWIQIHGRPLENFTIKNTAKISAKIGEVF